MATKPPALTDSSFDEASQVPSGAVGLDPTESILGGGAIPGGSLDRALQIHHQQRIAHAQMYRTNAATAIGKLAKGTVIDQQSGQERPLTPEEIQTLTAQKDEALQQYGKIIGVNKESKGALDKAHQIIDFILGRKQQQGRPGGMSTPPTPVPTTQGATQAPGLTPPSSLPQATVMDSGVTLTPPPAARQPSALEQSIAAPFAQSDVQFSKGQQRATTEQQRKFKTDVDQRTKEADILQLPEGSRIRAQYIATGAFPPVARLQKFTYTDPKDPKHKPQEGSYDPIEGVVYDQKGNIVEGAEPVALSSLTPKIIKYRPKNPDGSYQNAPDGTPIELFGIQRGNQLFDQGGNELPEGTEAFIPSLIPKTTTGTTEKIDPLTGKRLSLSSSKTTGPAKTKITGPGGYQPSGGVQARPGGGPLPPTPSGASSAPTTKPPAARLSGPAGTRAQQDADREAAYLHRNNLKNVTSSTRTMIEAAPKVENFVDKIQSQIDGLQNDLGPVAGRWNEFWAGKVGTKNPQYTSLRTDMGLLSTLLMRMHVGARGGEYIMKHFEGLIDQGKQDPDNLRAALKEIRDYAENVIQEGREQGIDMTPGRPGGYSAPPTPAGSEKDPLGIL